jgi:hypothetical protein
MTLNANDERQERGCFTQLDLNLKLDSKDSKIVLLSSQASVVVELLALL